MGNLKKETSVSFSRLYGRYMTVEEMQEIIGQFRNQGYNDMQISVAFGRLYLDDVCNYQDLRVLLGMLNMDIKKEFDEMSDEERKETLRKAFQIQ